MKTSLLDKLSHLNTAGNDRDGSELSFLISLVHELNAGLLQIKAVREDCCRGRVANNISPRFLKYGVLLTVHILSYRMIPAIQSVIVDECINDPNSTRECWVMFWYLNNRPRAAVVIGSVASRPGEPSKKSCTALSMFYERSDRSKACAHGLEPASYQIKEDYAV